MQSSRTLKHTHIWTDSMLFKESQHRQTCTYTTSSVWPLVGKNVISMVHKLNKLDKDCSSCTCADLSLASTDTTVWLRSEHWSRSELSVWWPNSRSSSDSQQHQVFSILSTVKKLTGHNELISCCHAEKAIFSAIKINSIILQSGP